MISDRFASLSRPVSGPVRWLAGATFTLYLMHMPVAQFISTLVPWPPEAIATRLVILGTTIIAVFLIAEFTERRKAAWRAAILALVRRAVPAV